MKLKTPIFNSNLKKTYLPNRIFITKIQPDRQTKMYNRCLVVISIFTKKMFFLTSRNTWILHKQE